METERSKYTHHKTRTQAKFRRFNPIKEAYVKQAAEEYPVWLESERQVLAGWHRLFYDLEGKLEVRWHQEIMEAALPITPGIFDNPTLKKLSKVTALRESLGRLLDLIEERVDFQFPRKKSDGPGSLQWTQKLA